jgi:hypothetical protein
MKFARPWTLAALTLMISAGAHAAVSAIDLKLEISPIERSGGLPSDQTPISGALAQPFEVTVRLNLDAQAKPSSGYLGLGAKGAMIADTPMSDELLSEFQARMPALPIGMYAEITRQDLAQGDETLTRQDLLVDWQASFNPGKELVPFGASPTFGTNFYYKTLRLSAQYSLTDALMQAPLSSDSVLTWLSSMQGHSWAMPSDGTASAPWEELVIEPNRVTILSANVRLLSVTDMSVVPEPGTALLWGIGGLALLGQRWRRQVPGAAMR